MGKKMSLSDVKRSQIVTLYDERYSERSISERVKCSKNAVHDAIVNLEIQGVIWMPRSLVDQGKPHHGTTTSFGEQQFGLQ